MSVEADLANNSPISSGTYYIEGTENELIKATVTIDTKNKTISFPVDPLSSYLPYGNYEIEDGYLRGKTDDGEYYITLEIIDKETLKFLEEESFVPVMQGARLTKVLYDGAIFSLVPGTDAYTAEEILSWFDGTGEPEVDLDAEPVWSEDGAIYYLPVTDERLQDLEAFLLQNFQQEDVKRLMETKVGDYFPFQEIDGVLYRGMGLVGNDDGSEYSDLTKEELWALAEEGTFVNDDGTDMDGDTLQELIDVKIMEASTTLDLFVYNISKDAKNIDSWAFDYLKYEEAYYYYYNLAQKNGEIQAPSLAFDENTRFYVNEEVGTTEGTEVGFETFANYINSRSALHENYGYEGAECFCKLRDGVIVSIVLQNPYPSIMNLTTVPKDHYFYENFGVEKYYLLKNSTKAKLNHDVDNTATDLVEVFTGNVGDGDSGMVLVYSGYPANEPFSIEAHTSRAGWTNIYLVNLDGKDYIFQFNFDARDRTGECSYYLYYFGEQLGEELAVYLVEGAAFSYDGEIDEDSYNKWAEKLNGYLKDAKLLLSTQDGEIRVGPDNDYDRYNGEALLERL